LGFGLMGMILVISLIYFDNYFVWIFYEKAIFVFFFSRFNNIFTCLNICVVIFVMVAGFAKANLSNWSIPAEELPSDEDHE
jgi:hypothetical protein